MKISTQKKGAALQLSNVTFLHGAPAVFALQALQMNSLTHRSRLPAPCGVLLPKLLSGELTVKVDLQVTKVAA